MDSAKKWAHKERPGTFETWTHAKRRSWVMRQRSARAHLGLCECCGRKPSVCDFTKESMDLRSQAKFG